VRLPFGETLLETLELGLGLVDVLLGLLVLLAGLSLPLQKGVDALRVLLQFLGGLGDLLVVLGQARSELLRRIHLFLDALFAQWGLMVTLAPLIINAPCSAGGGVIGRDCCRRRRSGSDARGQT